ncbi:unnamed protein product, partial [Discosporangium mesarthrocarpum]
SWEVSSWPGLELGLGLGKKGSLGPLSRGPWSRPGLARPELLFCSWGCARRWNAERSPVQLRHGRGVFINVAAGEPV